MLRNLVLCLTLLNGAIAWSATPALLLDMTYSEAFGFPGQSNPILATDSSGSVYTLNTTYDTSLLQPTATLGPVGGNGSFIVKLSPDGSKIAYLTVLGFVATALAVDAAGNAYITGPGTVAKLNPTGTAFVYQATIGAGITLSGIAVDQAGRAYVLGATAFLPNSSTTGVIQTTSNAFQTRIPNNKYPHSFVVRLNAAGSAVDYATYVAGSNNDSPGPIAVDSTGAATIAGATQSTDFPVTPGAYVVAPNPGGDITFLTRLAPDGSHLIYSNLPDPSGFPPSLAVDSDGNAALGALNFYRFSPSGALLFMKGVSYIQALAMDAAGNIYSTGTAVNSGYVTRNSLFPCVPDVSVYSSTYLTVYDPTGNILESTYLPEGAGSNTLAVAPGPAVYVAGQTGSAYTPTSTIAGLSSLWSLTRFAPATSIHAVQLACVGNAGSYYTGPVAAGEIVSLFGQGLGPAQGAQGQFDPQTGYPQQVSTVQVTFNGAAAPLLYVQDGQINAIVPWSLAGASGAQICVLYNGATTNCLSWPVANAAPGVFTVDGYYAAAVNQDGTINSATNPAPSGTLVSVFATGLGPISPAVQDGALVLPPLPTDDIQFMAYGRVGGIIFSYGPLETTYAGPAPYEVAGVSQVNFRVFNTSFELATPATEPVYFNSSVFGVYVSGN